MNIIILEKYFLLFMFYSIGGWIMEEVVCSIEEKRIVDRGFLIGPICPIYGVGGIAMTIFLSKFIGHPITLFCMAVIVSAVVEYFTSYIMEKLFNARWWDYSNEKLNLNGRICLKNLIPFGLFGLIIIYFVNPLLIRVFFKIPPTALSIVCISLLLILVLDVIVSMSVVLQVTDKAEKISKTNPKDNTDEITAKVKAELKETIAGSRLVDAFPNFKAFKTKIKEIAEKGKEAVIQGKQKVSDTSKKGKEAVAKKIKKDK